MHQSLKIPSSFKELAQIRHMPASHPISVHRYPSAGNYPVQNQIANSQQMDALFIIHYYPSSLTTTLLGNCEVWNCSNLSLNGGLVTYLPPRQLKLVDILSSATWSFESDRDS